LKRGLLNLAFLSPDRAALCARSEALAPEDTAGVFQATEYFSARVYHYLSRGFSLLCERRTDAMLDVHVEIFQNLAATPSPSRNTPGGCVRAT